jgi:hypothetical protein
VIPAALALVATLLHFATSWRYGYFRDELYFIACSKHLAWGYVDQPPLVALAAFTSAPFGYQLVALRLLPVLCSAGTVLLTAVLVRRLGGGVFAQLLAGVAVLLVPAYLLLGNVLTTTSFEPLSWTLAVYAVIGMIRSQPNRVWRWWLLLAAAIVFGAYGKYSIGLLAFALVAGLAATPQRALLRSAWPYVTLAVVLLLLAPNFAWQATHGWPFFEVLRGDAAHRHAFQSGVVLEFTDIARNAASFAVEQLVYTNLFAAPVWLAGVIAPFRLPGLRDLRFLPVAYVVTLVAAVALGAKGYYVIGIYASLLAVGAVAFERALAGWRAGVFAALTAAGVVALPFSLPILPIDGFVAYARALGLTGRNGAPTHVVQPVYAEEFGWQRLARDVAGVYFSLAPRERESAAVYADTYGDAGALDFYGPLYGLPPVISSQNSYYLWGTRGYDGHVLIAIGATRIDLLRKYYRRVVLARTSEEPYKWVVEGPAPIYLCRDPVAPLAAIWPYLRWYGA